MNGNRDSHHNDDERIREARELLAWIGNTRPADMDQLFYVHCHQELVLAVEDLLDVIEKRSDPHGSPPA